MAASGVVFAVLVIAFALSAHRLSRWYITAPIAFVAAGAVISMVVDAAPDQGTASGLAEGTLALLLFHDSAQVQPREIKRDRGAVARLLLVGLPLTVGVGYLVAWLLFPDLGWAFLLLLATALAPTDAGLGAATVLNPVVPVRIRRLLNVESGLNDGLVTPVVLFAIAAVAGEEGIRPVASLLGAVVELSVGVAVGIVVGVAGGRLSTESRARGWSTPATRAFAALALPVAAYTGAQEVSGNGFIAAFVAGTAYAASAPWLADEEVDLALTESLADLLGFVVWFIVGLVALDFVTSAGWRELLFAVLALTLLRMGPVWLSLLGTGLRPRTVAFVGWFGPRGLASVVFALLAVENLRGDQHLDTVITVIATTVLLSVVLHGVTAEPLARAYGAWVERERPAAETQRAVEPRSRARLFTRVGAGPRRF